MRPEDSRRQHRSARHYLSDGTPLPKLGTTVALVARTLGFPLAMVNILDQDTQHSISVSGGSTTSSPRAEAICDAVVVSGRPLALPDVRQHPDILALPSVAYWNIGAYFSVPLTGRESVVVGTLCVMDRDAHPLDAQQSGQLAEFGKIVEDQLELLRQYQERRVPHNAHIGELADAIRSGAITARYQPIVELATGRVVGFEALARWQHPDGTVLEPNRFVPLAEESDLVLELDMLVMRQALAHLAGWRSIRPDLRISVNLSGRHFDHLDTVDAVLTAVSWCGVPPRSVDLEITETTRLGDPHAVQVLRELRAAGFTLWLDDFGTGWSALDYLLKLPVDGIKIDRAVTVALGSRLGKALVRAITGLAGELGLATVIEGIETTGHALLADRLGCDLAQGYLWSKPMSAEAVPEFLQQREGRPFRRQSASWRRRFTSE